MCSKQQSNQTKVKDHKHARVVNQMNGKGARSISQSLVVSASVPTRHERLEGELLGLSRAPTEKPVATGQNKTLPNATPQSPQHLLTKQVP